MQRKIQHLVSNESWDALQSLLRQNDYCAVSDLNEIKALLTQQTIPFEVKHTAFLCLICQADLATIQAFSQPLFLSFPDADDTFGYEQYYAPVKTSALFLATLHGRREIMAWLKNELPLEQLAQINLQHDLLVAAACGGHIDVFRWLLQPTSESGFGCSLDDALFDDTNKFPLLSAIYRGKFDLWHEYNKPTEEGGLGLSNLVVTEYISGIISAAIKGIQLDFLKSLFRPKDEGGFEFPRDSVTTDDVLTSAFEKNNFSLLQSIVLPVEQGGWFGLKITFDDLLALFREENIPKVKQLEALQFLLIPTNAGGAGMILPDEKFPLKAFRPDLDKGKRMQKDAFALLAIEMHKRILLMRGLTSADKWFKTHLLDYTDSKVIREITDHKKAVERALTTPPASVVPVSFLSAPGGQKRAGSREKSEEEGAARKRPRTLRPS